MKRKHTRNELYQSLRREKKIQSVIRVGIVILIGVTVLTLICFAVGGIITKLHETEDARAETKKTDRPDMAVDLLTPNEYSRPQTPLTKVNGVVIHYTANPGTTGWDNRNYFENLKDTHTTKVSSHFIIGIDGTIIQCIPLQEIAYASNERNADTISIECCHPKKNGKFTEETYNSLVKLSAWLAGEYNLKEEDIIRHYDVTGKNCPKYFVEHEDKWEDFKKDVFKD